MTLRMKHNKGLGLILEVKISTMDSPHDFEFFGKFQKALDQAAWRNFSSPNTSNPLVVVRGPEENYAVLRQSDALDAQFPILTPRGRKDGYHDLSFERIEQMRTEDDPLEHWESLNGAIATISNKLLRYILDQRIPLEKFIRYELAIRGYDEKGEWVGYERAKRIWCK